VQDLRIGGRQSAAEYQYTLTSEDTAALYNWVPKLVTELGKDRDEMVDVNSDMQQNGLQTYVTIERATAAALWFEPNQIDNVLYDAFGQRTGHHDFQSLQPILRGHGGGAEVLAVSADARPHSFQHGGGQSERHAADSGAGGTVSGVTPTRPVVGAAARRIQHQLAERQRQANAVTNSISNSRGGSSTGSADSTAAETMVPLPAMATM
jgi:multidrug efflux pump